MALPTASDNQFPKVILEEVATDGSATVTPAADHQAVFLGEDGNLHKKDSSGTVTDIGGGSETLPESIIDAAGDLIIGDGADSAVRLAIGTAGQVLTVNSGATAPEWATPAGGGGKSYVTAPGLRPPDSADAADIEFQDYANATNPTAGPGLTWGNQNAASAAVQQGRLVMNSGANNNLHALLLATPGAGNFTFDTTIQTYLAEATRWAGMVMLWGTPGTPTAIRTAGQYWVSNQARFVYSTYNTSWVPTADDASVIYDISSSPWYTRIAWDGTNCVYYVSPSGIVGTYMLVTSQAEGLGRPDYVGVGVNLNDPSPTINAVASFDFFRFNWTADFDPTTDD